MSTDALLPLRDVRTHLRVLGEHYVGLQEIPVERIVGSVNRSVDFDRFFRTGKRHLRKRLDALREAFGDRPMPPGLKRAYDFKTQGDLYLWTSQKLRELRTTHRQATWTDAAGLLARIPVDRTHRRDTVAARRKPLPRHADSP